MSKEKQNKTELFLSVGRGNNGKTTALTLIADYLTEKSERFFVTDCDTENGGKLSSFAHWFGDKTIRLNLKNRDDCDRLLEGAASSGAPYVLADLPANVSGDVAPWWQSAVTPQALQELGVNVTAVGVVTKYQGSAEIIWDWVDTLGSAVSYLVALNRLVPEWEKGELTQTFSDWFRVKAPEGIAMKTFEIPNLYGSSMEALVRSGKLPSQVLREGKLPVLTRSRIFRWRNEVHANLEATGLFQPEAAESLAVAK
jgi:hypothetical protein